MALQFEALLIDFVQTVTTDLTVNADTDLLAIEYLDSLLLTDLIDMVEDETGFFLSDDETMPWNFRTIGDIVRMVERKSFSSWQGRFAA